MLADGYKEVIRFQSATGTSAFPLFAALTGVAAASVGEAANAAAASPSDLTPPAGPPI
jgi:hypothetical protein